MTPRAYPNAKDNEVGDTPLILAAGKGYKEIVELLLAHGADVNAADNMGTPLARAIHTDHNDIADLTILPTCYASTLGTNRTFQWQFFRFRKERVSGLRW